MGTWKIEIHGHGIHHNKRADDANEMAAEFVKALRRDSHEVSAATFTLTPSGLPEDLAPVTDVGPAAVSEHIMQFFTFEHLPPHLQKASKPFRGLRRSVDTFNETTLDAATIEDLVLSDWESEGPFDHCEAIEPIERHERPIAYVEPRWP